MSLFSPVVKPLVNQDVQALIPHGIVSKYHIPFLTNPIDACDPIESFGSHIQVLDDGVLYQWEVATFERVDGSHYGRWQSKYVDLHEFDETYDEFQELMQAKVRIAEEENEYVIKATAYIEKLKAMRAKTFTELLNVHEELKKNDRHSRSKVVNYRPPLLSHFETMAVTDGEISTVTSMAPLFYRSALRHSYAAEDLLNGSSANPVGLLDQIYEERAQAIIMAAACLEAVINEVGGQKYSHIWNSLEKLSIGEKLKFLFNFSGKPEQYDISRSPFQSISKIVTSRNDMIHFKPEYRKVTVKGNQTITRLSFTLENELVARIPAILAEAITEISTCSGLNPPPWIIDQPGWKISKN